MKWTQERPTQEGWYWTRLKNDPEDVQVRWVEIWMGAIHVTDADTSIDVEHIADWAGPIPEPE